MKTQIFATYEAFLNREDKYINGVTQQFADANPGWDEERGNEGCWNCFDCSYCSGCHDCSYCFKCSDCSGCYSCSDCSNCFNCHDCSYCHRCSYCSSCFRCSSLKNARPVEVEEGESSDNPMAHIPVIPNIHQRVFEAASHPGALEMDNWNTCDTTHCRAGWVVTLAGEAGRKLEAATSTLFAAMQIYHKSSPIPVSPTQFFETNEAAMQDMERCAKEESVAMEGAK